MSCDGCAERTGTSFERAVGVSFIHIPQQASGWCVTT
jgi:hypothetical protein